VTEKHFIKPPGSGWDSVVQDQDLLTRPRHQASRSRRKDQPWRPRSMWVRAHELQDHDQGSEDLFWDSFETRQWLDASNDFWSHSFTCKPTTTTL